MDKEYIDFRVSPYALKNVLLAFHNDGITEFTVTLEDEDLHIRIEKYYLQSKVYSAKFRSYINEKDVAKEGSTSPTPAYLLYREEK